MQPESLSCCYPSADLEGDVTPLADLEGAVDGRCRCGFAWLSWCIEVLELRGGQVLELRGGQVLELRRGRSKLKREVGAGAGAGTRLKRKSMDLNSSTTIDLKCKREVGAGAGTRLKRKNMILSAKERSRCRCRSNEVLKLRGGRSYKNMDLKC